MSAMHLKAGEEDLERI